MKTSKLLVGLAFVGMSAAACSVKTKTATGSSGAGGDASTVGVSTSTTVGPTTGPTSTSTGASTSTGGSGCDDGTMDDSGSSVCSACIQCAAQSTCSDATAKCGMGSECAAFDDCRIACVDTADANKNMDIEAGAETDAFYACLGLDSMSGKPDPALTMSCAAKSPTGYTDWDAWFTCIFGDCPNNCGTGGGGGGTAICDSGFASSNMACADCLSKNCCTEFTACGADADCKSCLIDQDMAKCDKGMKDEAAEGCFSNKCMNECK